MNALHKFTLGDYELVLDKFNYYQPYGSDEDSWGTQTFVSQNRCKNDYLFTYDGTLRLEADIDLLEQEVTAESKDQSEVIMELKTETQYFKTSFKRNISDLKIEIYDMKNMIQSLNISDQTRESRLRLDCTSCIKILRTPMRQMQCGQGQIVCDHCYTRIKDKKCPSCR